MSGKSFAARVKNGFSQENYFGSVLMDSLPISNSLNLQEKIHNWVKDYDNCKSFPTWKVCHTWYYAMRLSTVPCIILPILINVSYAT